MTYRTAFPDTSNTKTVIMYTTVKGSVNPFWLMVGAHRPHKNQIVPRTDG